MPGVWVYHSDSAHSGDLLPLKQDTHVVCISTVKA